MQSIVPNTCILTPFLKLLKKRELKLIIIGIWVYLAEKISNPLGLLCQSLLWFYIFELNSHFGTIIHVIFSLEMVNQNKLHPLLYHPVCIYVCISLELLGDDVVNSY